MIHSLVKLAKKLQFLTPLRSSMVHRFDYFFWPEELHYLCKLMEETLAGPGCIVEVGCAHGATTVYLNKHLDWAEQYNGMRKDTQYVCLDTFSGFVDSHVQHERGERGKADESFDSYQINSPEWFRYMLKLNGVSRVAVHQADAATFDYSAIGPIAFCLLDVDLYLPTKAILPEIHKRLAPNGVIVVDDCQPSQIYDGARQAYIEYTEQRGITQEIQHRKFGLIRAAASKA